MILDPHIVRRQQASNEHPVLLKLLVSGTSVSVATTCTNPIDVVKVHLQLRNDAAGAQRMGMLRTFRHLLTTEGPQVFFRGLTPSLVRAGLYGGLRLGLYEPLKDVVGLNGQSGHGGDAVARRVAAGSLSGGFAAAVANPLDLMKTRLQAARRVAASTSAAASTSGAATVGYLHAPAAAPPASAGVAAIARDVLRTDGVLGFWRGTGPSVMRSAALTASQCATYDEAKHLILSRTGWDDSLAAQFCASMLTGLVTTTATNPVDVVKTRMFVTSNAGSKGGALACAADILQREGPRGFLRGWSANYFRLGPQTCITFVVVEQLRMWTGLGHF